MGSNKYIKNIFQNRLILVLTLAFLMAFTFTTVFFTLQGYFRVLNRNIAEIECFKSVVTDILSHNRSSVSNFQNNSKVILDDLSRGWLENKMALEEGDLKAYLENLEKTSPFVSEINIIDRNGIIVNSTDPLNKGYVMDSNSQSKVFYSQVMESMGNYTFQDLQERGIDKKKMMYVGLGVKNDELSENIIIQIGIEKEWAEDINNAADVTILDAQMKTSDYEFLLIVDKKGQVLATGREDLLGENIFDLLDITLQDQSGAGNSALEKEKVLYVYESFTVEQGETTQKFLQTTEDTCYLMSVTYYSTLFKLRNTVMIVLIVSLPLTLIAIYFVISKVVKTQVLDGIYALNKGMKNIIEGDLSVKLNVDSNIEFSNLSQDINATVAALKGHIEFEKTRNEQELELAWAIQSATLPDYHSFIRVPEVDIYTYITPAKNVGGDFYDFFRLEADKFAFLIADVSGKGIPAALFMMHVKNAIKNYLLQGMPLMTALMAANNELAKNNDEMMFATVFAAIFDLKTGELEYVNAGHTTPVLTRNNKVIEIKCSKGRFLGAIPDIELNSNFYQMQRGDKLLLYTDGITEALNEKGMLFAKKRMLATLDDLRYETSLHLVGNKLIEALNDFVGNAEQADDITLLLFSWETEIKNIKIPAKIEKLPEILEVIKEFLDTTQANNKIKNQFITVLEELFVNIVYYSYSDEEEGMVEISLYTKEDGNEVILRLADDGIPFDPTNVGEKIEASDIMEVKIGGLGLLMVRNFMDEVQYERSNNKNILYLVKKIN